MTNPGAAGPGTGRSGTRTAGPAARWGAILLAAGAAGILAWTTLRGDHVDFEVYARAGGRWLAGEDLYAQRAELPFTYPPFAALLSVPMALAPELALLLLSVLTVAVAASGALRASGLTLPAVRGLRRAVDPGAGPDAACEVPSRGASAPGRSARRAVAASPLAAVVVAVAVVSVPVLRGLHLGQVNGLVVGLVLVDLLVVPRRWRGLLTGLAAGIKLTPLVFVLLPLVRREWDIAARIGTGFALTVAAGALALPAGSATYWGGLVGDADRVGAPGFADNQSLLGALTRLAPGHATVLWILACLAVLGLGVAALVRGRDRAAVDGVIVCALVGLLVSPISWSHHWLLLPAAAFLCARERKRLVAGAVLAVAMLGAPLDLEALAEGLRITDTGLGALVVSPLTLAGLACLVALARRPQGPAMSALPRPVRFGLRPFAHKEVRPGGAWVCRQQEATTMSPHESNLQPDGTVFPPVTPDPPLPPGQEEIVVPEVIPPADTAGPTQPTEDPEPTEQPD